MKTKTLLFAIFATAFAGNVAPRVLAAPMKTATSDAQLLAQARSRYAEISRNLSRYRVVKRDNMESSEGGETLAYFDGKELRRLIGLQYFGTFRRREEYSFESGKLFFAHFTREHYAIPADIHKSPIESGIVGLRIDERFYFHGGRLFRRVVERRELKKPPHSLVTNGQTKQDSAEAVRIFTWARELLKEMKSSSRAR